MRPIKIAVSTALLIASLSLLLWVFAPKAGAGSLKVTAIAADGVWKMSEASSVPAGNAQSVTAAGSRSVLRLNKDALAQQLALAPMERTGDLRNSPSILAFPMPDGSFQHFHVEESPVVDAELVAGYPEIKSYRGEGIEDGTASVRFDWTPLGLHALILSADHPAVNIQPPNPGDTATYASYYDKGAAFECGVNESHKVKQESLSGISPNVAIGTTLRTE